MISWHVITDPPKNDDRDSDPAAPRIDSVPSEVTTNCVRYICVALSQTLPLRRAIK